MIMKVIRLAFIEYCRTLAMPNHQIRKEWDKFYVLLAHFKANHKNIGDTNASLKP